MHCYRMLGSFEEAEDLVQDTFMRAWRGRESFEGRSTVRAWLYRIATNACLDLLRQRSRRLPGEEPSREVPPADLPWLQPFPDSLLENVADTAAGPDEALVAKETIELVFIVAIQYLAPRQRAVLILRDVLGWSANETAALLEMSIIAVNSALQRARERLGRRLPATRTEWPPGFDSTAEERALLERYMEANERANTAALVELTQNEARFTMPPTAGVYVGPEEIVAFWTWQGLGSPEFGEMRCLPTQANRQPAVACYLKGPEQSKHNPMSLDVLRIEEGRVADIVTFPPDLFSYFGLPAAL